MIASPRRIKDPLPDTRSGGSIQSTLKLRCAGHALADSEVGALGLHERHVDGSHEGRRAHALALRGKPDGVAPFAASFAAFNNRCRAMMMADAAALAHY